LAIDAVRAGTEVFVKTRALGLFKKDSLPCSICAQREGIFIKMSAPLVIGADGIESKVGRWASINTA